MIVTSHALNHVLKDWPQWPILNRVDASACDFTPLEQGLTNENWLVTLPDDNSNTQFVIRINAQNAKELNIDHQSEFEIVQRISNLNLCPQITFKESTFKYWVRPYICGNTLAEIQSQTPSYQIQHDLAEVANVLSTIHKQPTQPNWPSVNTIERTEYFWPQIIPRLIQHKSAILKCKVLLDELLKSDIKQASLCHMDTNTHNWIKDKSGKLNLIDWEYAGLGNPIWDLAVFSDSAKLSRREEQDLLSHYGQNSLEELHHAKRQMEYLSILWFAVQENTDCNTLLCELNNLVARSKQPVIVR